MEQKTDGAAVAVLGRSRREEIDEGIQALGRELDLSPEVALFLRRQWDLIPVISAGLETVRREFGPSEPVGLELEDQELTLVVGPHSYEGVFERGKRVIETWLLPNKKTVGNRLWFHVDLG